jgi:hypothetical protein
VSGCGPAGKAYTYPLDKQLRLDEVQVKGTHNSYHVQTVDLPEWRYTMAPLDVQLDRQGVRQVELDLNFLRDEVGEGRHFEVYHVVAADEGTTCRLFTDCLRTIAAWSERFPGHLPIYVQMETKSGFTPALADALFARLEQEILSVFPRQRILTPDELRGASATLPAALAGGWPTLDRLRGRVIFNIDEGGEIRNAYTHGGQDLAGRLCFVDSGPADPFGAIAILNDPVSSAAQIRAALDAHLLVRTRADTDGAEARAGDMSRFQAALDSGAQFISTDFPAPVAGSDYFIAMPDGTPARCNPASASAACTSRALEDPAFVGSAR